MVIEVLRIGQRVVRDNRVTTHVALVSRAFGAKKIFMNEVSLDIKATINNINETWGGNFQIEIIDNWRTILKQKKKDLVKIVHLTMYGEAINKVSSQIKNEKDILIIVSAKKVPREVYDLADYNISIGNQPHSEISALAILLDRIQDGKQFLKTYDNVKRRIIPTSQGKKVIINKT